MPRVLDYIALTIITFLLVFVWTGYLFNLVIALTVASAFTVIAVGTVYYVKSKRNKPYGHERLALELSVRGSKYLVDLLKSTIKNAEFENGINYILLSDSIVIAAFKFAPLGINDIGNIFSLAMEKDRKRIFVLARGIDRRAASVLQTHGIKLSVIRIRAIYKYLDSHNALPPLEKEKSKFSFRALIDTVLSRSNLKNYLFSGAVLISFAFLTPLKIYYMVFGSFSLLLALLTITPLGNGSFNSDKLFERLKEEDEVNTLSSAIKEREKSDKDAE